MDGKFFNMTKRIFNNPENLSFSEIHQFLAYHMLLCFTALHCCQQHKIHQAGFFKSPNVLDKY